MDQTAPATTFQKTAKQKAELKARLASVQSQIKQEGSRELFRTQYDDVTSVPSASFDLQIDRWKLAF